MTTRSARPGPGRDRATYGDVGRIVQTFQQRLPDHKTRSREEVTAAHDAIRDEEPRRRYARVEDRDGHRWERGNTRWRCLTDTGALPWSSLVSMYGPLTVLDENLPAPKPEPAPRCESKGPFGDHTQLIPEEDDWAGGTHTTCNICGSRVRFRVRGTDRPPSARILPHRTDGTPTR